ncbi:MAG: DUF1294 domain-containing protein [Planctomycetota bacterium]
MKYFFLAYVAAVLVLSIVAFLLYGWDKRRARRDGDRVPEKTLQLIALLGGWPGALLGQRFFRHKTQKTSFQIIFWLCVLLHIAIVGGIFGGFLWSKS